MGEFEGGSLSGASVPYTTTIGDGIATSFTITHNLNADDVSVSVRDVGTNQYVLPTITRIGANSLTLGFAVAPTASQYSVKVRI